MSENYTSSTDFLQKLANSAMMQAGNAESKIWSLAEPDADAANLLEPTFEHTVGKPSLGPPPKLTDVLDIGDTTDPRLKKLDADTDAWMAKYFPAMGDCLKSMPEDFLCGVISGVKPFGLDKTVFELVWHNARDRAYRAASSEQRQLESAFTGRGFTIPPGAMIAAMSEVSERASDAIHQVNREQAIKDAEIKLELLKFAEEQALNYKLGVLNALGEFYRQWVLIPNNDMEKARIKAQAMSSLYGALSSYYNVETAFEELRMKAKQGTAEVALQVDRNRIANREANDVSGKASGLGQAARAFGDIASQAASSAGTLVAEIESM